MRGLWVQRLKKETYELKAFADDLVLVCTDSLKGIKPLMSKLKEFENLGHYQVSRLANKTKMLTKII